MMTPGEVADVCTVRDSKGARVDGARRESVSEAVASARCIAAVDSRGPAVVAVEVARDSSGSVRESAMLESDSIDDTTVIERSVVVHTRKN